MRYHFIPVQMEAIKNESMLRRMWTKGNHWAVLVGVEINTMIVETVRCFPEN